MLCPICYDAGPQSGITACIPITPLRGNCLLTQCPSSARPVCTAQSLGDICSGASPDPEVFSDLFETDLPAVVLRLVERLGKDVGADLQQTDYRFQPLLPEDDSTLAERLAALGQWCDWFNIGFSAGYMQPQLPLSVDVMEILNDFGQLAEVEAPDAGSEDDEHYFMELVEYVRMAALAVSEQMQADPQRGRPDAENAAPDGTAQPFNATDDDRLLH